MGDEPARGWVQAAGTRPGLERQSRWRRYASHWRDAGLVARMFVWRILLPVLKSSMPLRRLVRVMWARPRTDQRHHLREAHLARLVAFVDRSTGRVISSSGNCLERSLLLYRYLSVVNASPVLRIGIGKTDDAVKGHAWLEVDGSPIAESPTVVEKYRPAASFGARGLPLDTRSPPSDEARSG